MPVITELKLSRDKKSINLYLDGSFAFTLSSQLALESKLKIGNVIDTAAIEKLKRYEEQRACHNSACRLINYRLRSRKELEHRLGRKGFNEATIQAVIERLQTSGLVDDSSFARCWAENRSACKPKSASLIRMELKHKGVDEDTIRQAISTCDDLQNARQAARPRAAKLAGADRLTFRYKLSAFLSRRGFSFDVTRQVIEELWHDITHGEN
jgi:regulatory protein